jgi:hypothetical protein
LLREIAPQPGEFDLHAPAIHVNCCLELSNMLRSL